MKEGKSEGEIQSKRLGEKVAALLVTLCIFGIAFIYMENRAVQEQPSGSTVWTLRTKKSCEDVCSVRLQQRIEHFDGRDILKRQDLKELVTAAKERLIEKLKVDYGEEYFYKIFTNPDSGLFVPHVPVGDESLKLLKRKLMIKVLSAQRSLEQQEKNVNGCDCTSVDGQGRMLKDCETSSDILIDSTYEKYVWATGGHSASAGHGNLFNESYTAYLERDMMDIFGSIGIEFEARNHAMGGTPSASEISMCWEEIFGVDVDFFSYDYGMTDAGVPWRIYYYAYRGGVSRGRPSFLALNVKKSTETVLKPLAELGLPIFIQDSDLATSMREAIPNSQGLEAKDINALPEFLRNLKCGDQIEKGEPFCEAEKYSSAVCPNREGKAPWHPGFKVHAMTGHSIALFLTDVLLAALDELLDLEMKDLDDVMAKLKEEDNEHYDKRIVRGHLQDFPKQVYPLTEAKGEIDDDSELDILTFFRGRGICHTARLPAMSRYLGHLTNTQKVGGPAVFGEEEYETGIEFKQAILTASGGKSDSSNTMQLGFDRDKWYNQQCSVVVGPDRKDFFFVLGDNGWNEIIIPNPAEKVAYRYDPSVLEGLVVLVFRTCNWGKCEEHFLKPEDFSAGKKWEMQINGIAVTKLVDIGHSAHVAKNKRGFHFPPSADGNYKIAIQVNEPSGFVKISSFIIF